MTHTILTFEIISHMDRIYDALDPDFGAHFALSIVETPENQPEMQHLDEEG